MRDRFPTRQVVPDPSVARPYRERDGVRLLTLDPVTLHAAPLMRFVMGEDAAPRMMSPEEVQALGDVFTRRLLLARVVPKTPRELIGAIRALVGPAFDRQSMFLIAEGGQSRTQELNDRLVFTWQVDSNTAPDLMLSTVADPDNPSALMQLIAWSEDGGEFHFFERQRESGLWAWAGSSRHALETPTRGKGPFDSHINGSLVMKELKAPWAHWHSQDSSIGRDRFPVDSQFNTDPLFESLSGAEALEAIVRQGIRRWTKRRISARIRNGVIQSLPQLMRQLLWSTSINLVSAPEVFSASHVKAFSLPVSFFYDQEGLDHAARKLNPAAQIIPKSRLRIEAALYRSAIAAGDFRVSDGATAVEGDTHFAFLVPERAAEDHEVLREMISAQILSPKMALALLMIDFCNPVFSPARARLLRYCPETAVVGAQGSDLEREFVAAIQQSREVAEEPERRFLELMGSPNLADRCRTELAAFHAAIEARLNDPQGVADILILAGSRRRVCRSDKRQLFEFEATLTQAAMPINHLEMTPLATLSTKATDTGEGEL